MKNKLMGKLFALVLLGVSISFLSYSQSSNPWELGAEYQHDWGKHFSGNDLGATYEYFPSKSSWTVGIHYSFSSHGSGKESNKGSGFGFSGGYRIGFGYGASGNLFTGVRATFSFEKTDKGTSYSLFKPSINVGYHLTFNNFGSGGFTTPSVGFGYDVKMSSEKAGTEAFTGPFFNTRVAIGYRF